MTTIVPAFPAHIIHDDVDLPTFDRVTGMVLKTIAESSARVYLQTYRAWAAYTAGQGINPLKLHPDVVYAFLAAGQTTHATRKRQLSALRPVVELLAQMDGPTYSLYYTV